MGHKKRYAKLISKKRLWKILEIVGNHSTDIDSYLLKKIKAPQLDPINKKFLKFPQSLFPMQNAPVEWWYFTGHLIDKEDKKNKFGFEFCFFKVHPEIIRIGFIPLYLFRKKPYLVMHSTITDKNKNIFEVKQDSGLIHEDTIHYNNLNLKLDNSSIKLEKNFKIKNDQMNLTLKPIKSMVKHFDKGFQMMHKKSHARAYYMSFTRLNTKGKIRINNKHYSVNGQAWFDHQKCNMLKKSSLLGWDWFSIMLSDNTELMFYMIRDKRGISRENIGGSYIKKDSSIIKLSNKDIKIKNLENWTSPKTSITYPSSWLVNIPKLKIKLKINPAIKNQEVDTLFSTGVSYWEGACEVEGTKNNKKITGDSYVELVGYDNRIIQKLIKEAMVE